MTFDFSDHFWGSKNNGFEVLYQNMKYSIFATKELADFFRERSSVEEAHSKALLKLIKTSAGYGSGPNSFSPLWTLLKSSSEQLSTIQGGFVTKIQDLLRDVGKYGEELAKKCKQVKEEEATTLESVQTLQATAGAVSKSKEVYFKWAGELEKVIKERDGALASSGAAPGKEKEVEKMEVKVRKALEEYRGAVEKYSGGREDFERKMTLASKHFQEVEKSHLRQIKDFLGLWAEIMEENQVLVGSIHSEFRRQCQETTVDYLLEQLVATKGTGTEKPEVLEVEEYVSSGGSGGPDLTFGGLPTLPESKGSPGSGSGGPDEGKVESSGAIISTSTTTSTTGRRTTSLLNLFIPSSASGQGFGRKEKSTGSPSLSLDLSRDVGAPSRDKSSLTRGTNSRGSKSGEVGGTGDNSPSISSSIQGFLRSRRDKKKEKAEKKEKAKKGQEVQGTAPEEAQKTEEPREDLLIPIDNDFPPPSTTLPGLTSTTSSGGVGVASNSTASGEAFCEVDEEGYSVPPPKSTIWENDKSSFYSDSDSDSDFTERERKIHVEIKPLSNGQGPLSASVDELRTTVENMNMALGGKGLASLLQGPPTSNLPPGIDPSILEALKRSQSASQGLGSPPAPSNRHPYAPLSPPLGLPNATAPPNAPGSRYAELGDLFSELGDFSSNPTPALPPKNRSTSPPISGAAIPRPPSRARPSFGGGESNLRNQPSPLGSCLSRGDSVNSGGSTGGGYVPLGGSRGPSPLTLGMANSIPLAVAFHEIIHSTFRGTDESKCQIKMTGDLMLSFPAGIIGVFANNPSPAPLSFRVKTMQGLANLQSNKEIVQLTEIPADNELLFEFQMSALSRLLKRNSEQNPNASYYNVDILKYQVSSRPGVASCPLHLVAFWKCERSQTDLRIDYKYNSRAVGPAVPGELPGGVPSLVQVCIAAPVDGGVKTMQSKPNGQWFGNTNRAVWKLGSISHEMEGGGVGSLRARFEVLSGPSSHGTIAAQFSCENSTLSGSEIQDLSPGYRISLIKKRFVSGKYTCDSDSGERYAIPPGDDTPVTTSPTASAPSHHWNNVTASPPVVLSLEADNSSSV